jgi:hypothetical protein
MPTAELDTRFSSEGEVRDRAFVHERVGKEHVAQTRRRFARV